MNMHADEKSDEGVRPEKRPNKGGLTPAEAVEERTSPEGNGGRTAAVRTSCRRRAFSTTPGSRVERAGRRAPSGATE